MLFEIKVRTADGREWWEKYDKEVEDARVWAEETIESFNATLSHGEQPRILLDVRVLDADSVKDHSWVKYTSGQSVIFRGHVVDLMFCKRCGITGKRYGISGRVKIDSKYRAKKFNRCDTSMEAMGRAAEAKE